MQKLNTCSCGIDMNPAVFKDVRFVKTEAGDWEEYSTSFSVECQYCGNDSPGISEEEAIDAWNAINQEGEPTDGAQ